MTVQRTCYSTTCGSEIRWGVVSSATKTGPDGSPLTLYSCDDHEPPLTKRLRTAGTRYQLFPVVKPAPAEPTIDPSLGWVRPCQAPKPEPIKNDEPELDTRRMSWIGRAVTKVVVLAVSLAIAPAIIGYYGTKWFFGWRPHKNA